MFTVKIFCNKKPALFLLNKNPCQNTGRAAVRFRFPPSRRNPEGLRPILCRLSLTLIGKLLSFQINYEIMRVYLFPFKERYSLLFYDFVQLFVYFFQSFYYRFYVVSLYGIQ